MSDKEIEKLDEDLIRGRIYSIRGFQVMLDRDLAELYGVETKILNKAVKRNSARFPENFCFKLTPDELESLRFHFGTIENGRGRHSKYLPYVFTEQGVAMLAGILTSETAVRVSIYIMNAFVAMRKFIQTNGQLFQRVDNLEIKLIETDKKVEKILGAMESGDLKPVQGIFFEGQIFDAYNFVSELFRGAEKSILIIDNYIDDSVLVHLTKVKSGVSVRILTRYVTDQFKLDVKKFEAQYFPVEVKVFPHSHDRFIIIDGRDVYHVGASLKDLGKKWVGFSKFGKSAIDILGRLEELD
ncbi:MAG TPA: ORF6N domain-containing protein [Clostridiales bacterium]|jgi:hypothetical protein|nr:ORF6N domain-containing protein [Clostridiales bacterium]HQP70559.1 ORF6N domain-containing protein [Clostridiales bacterium]